MAKSKSIKKNYFYNLLFQCFSLIIPIITTPYLSRILGVSGIGSASYTLSIVSYFILFGGVGVATYGQREIAMNRDNPKEYSKVFWELVIYKSITTIISIIFYLIFIFVNNSYNIIYTILIINIVASIFDISWFFQGLEEYKMITIRNILVKLLFTISIFVFVKKETDLNLYIFLNSCSLIISNGALWLCLPKYIKKINKKLNIFAHTKSTIIYFLPQIATQMYTMLDKTMLGIITGSEIENGYYEQAHKLILILLTVITSLNTVMEPRMSYLYKNKNHQEIKTRLLKSLRFSCFLAIPMCLGIIAVSNGFVDWFFGSGFEKVKVLLPIFSPIILAIALSNCLGGQCLTPCGKRAKSAIVLWIGAIFNLIINSILIPIYGSIGATIASVLAETIITTLYFVLAKEYIPFKEFMKKIWKYLLSGIIMFIIVLGISNNLEISILNTLIEVSIGMIVYFILLIILKDDFITEVLKGVWHYGQKVFFKRRKNM